MAEISLVGIDPEELLLRLTSHAYGLFKWFPDGDDIAVPGDGSGPEDLVMSVLTRFLDPDDQTVGWKSGWGHPTAPKLLGYLKTVLYHDFLDIMRSKRHTTTVPASVANSGKGEPTELSLEDFCASVESPQGYAIRRQQRDQILASLADEPELQELLMVQFEPEAYQAFTNQELATLLEISVAEVVNRKKRLSRRLHRIHTAAKKD